MIMLSSFAILLYIDANSRNVTLGKQLFLIFFWYVGQGMRFFDPLFIDALDDSITYSSESGELANAKPTPERRLKDRVGQRVP